MPSTRLADLTEAALHNITRHLSSRPKDASWTEFVSVEDALTSLHPSSPLSSLARSSFSEVNSWRGPEHRAGLMNLSLEDVERQTKWMQCSGESLVKWGLRGPLNPTFFEISEEDVLRFMYRIGPTFKEWTVPENVLRAV